MRRLVIASLLLLAAGAAFAYHIDHGERPAPETLLVKNATIWTQSDAGILEGHDLLIKKGKISKLGRGLKAPPGAMVIDADGKHVTPGLIDCHSHTAIRGGVNEGSNNVTAEVRIGDVVNPTDINLYRQLAGGLTAAHLLHGSANSIGGQDAVIKLRWGADAAELRIEDASPGIKFALGENPKRSNFNFPGVPERYPSTRMGVNQAIRNHFLAARDYMRQWEAYENLSAAERARTEPPRRDLQLDAIAEILRGERVIHSHSYRQDEILALLRLTEEFGIRIATFQHVLEGFKVADELAAHGAGASTFSDWWAFKLEAYDAIPYNGALMHDRGVNVTFNSDSSELARRMNLEAAKAIKYGGVEPQAALNFVTLNAAKQLGIDHRTGSLERGKDADFVIWSGDPLSTMTIAEQTWVDGRREFDRKRDLELRERVAAEREALIAAVKRGDKPAEEDEEGEEEEEEAEKPEEALGAPLFSNRPRPFSDRLAGLAGRHAIVGATVHTMAGATLEDATVSIENGRIVAVGRGATPLDGAAILDAKGLHVWPGMIDAISAVGLIEIGSVRGSVDISETGDLNPEVNTALALNPDSELIPVARANGLTHVIAAPGGGLVSGTSSLVRLTGWTWEDLNASGPVALHVRWPSFRSGGRGRFGGGGGLSEEDRKKRREEQIEKIGGLFDDARAYLRARDARGDGVDADPRLESLRPVIDGDLPVVIHADQIEQVKSALAWAEEEGLRVILAGAGDLWRMAEMLAAREIPVIVTSVLRTPTREDEPYDSAYRLPAVLRQAGVRFAISSGGGSFGSSSARNLPYHAAMAAAFGLDREAAYKAVTAWPAEILGFGEHLGTIEVGKAADLIVTDGDPLEIRTRVEAVYVDGHRVDPDDNKHYRLYERYRARPRVASTR